MKAQSRTTIIVLIAFLFMVNKGRAQFYSNMSVGLNAGTYIYQGDLTPERFGSSTTIQPGLSVFAKKPVNHFLGIRLHLSFARLKGDESRYAKPEYRQQRNFAFSSPVVEFSGQLVWNILGRNYTDHGIMPYLFSGAGVSLVRIRKDYSRMDPTVFGENSDVLTGLAIDNVRGTPNALLAIPVGIGAEFPLSQRFSVNVEASYRFIFTDYLDGFSQSAGPEFKDHYHSSSAGLIYKFGKKIKGLGCPVINY